MLILAIYFQDNGSGHNVNGQAWEYVAGSEEFTFFQNLPSAIGSAGVDHFYYGNEVYVFYTQHKSGTTTMHYHTVFKWFVCFVTNTTKNKNKA